MMKYVIIPRVYPRRARRGFTLLEAAMAQIIVGVAITAMCELLACGTQANSDATDLTVAVNLANNVHEAALGLPLACPGNSNTDSPPTLWEFNGKVFSPPLGVTSSPPGKNTDWSQQVTVQSVDNNFVGSVVVEDRTSPIARLTVSIYHHRRFVYSASWLVAAAPASKAP